MLSYFIKMEGNHYLCHHTTEGEGQTDQQRWKLHNHITSSTKCENSKEWCNISLFHFITNDTLI